MAETDFTQFNIGGSTSTDSSAIIGEVVKLASTANLAVGASIDFDFNNDYAPIYDALCFANLALDIAVFVRQSSSDTFRQLGATTPANAANAMGNPLSGRRLPGSQTRIRFTNNGAATTTSLSIQVHARSL